MSHFPDALLTRRPPPSTGARSLRPEAARQRPIPGTTAQPGEPVTPSLAGDKDVIRCGRRRIETRPRLSFAREGSRIAYDHHRGAMA